MLKVAPHGKRVRKVNLRRRGFSELDSHNDRVVVAGAFGIREVGVDVDDVDLGAVSQRLADQHVIQDL